jgi:2-polyprenyl-3-methyl-5-hydroxy-6-metoxy-1,4-benzoquinol methylase
VAVCHGEVFPHTCLDEIGFDAYAAFPPHNFDCQNIKGDKKLVSTTKIFDYGSGVNAYFFPNENTTIYEGCTLGWDNTPRFGQNATIYLNFTLNLYYSWLRKIIDYTRAKFRPEERFVFINAWNEWAEGTYLEPDKKYGYAYLNTTSKALFDMPTENYEKHNENTNDKSAGRYIMNYEWMRYLIENHGEHALAVINGFIKTNCDILEFGPSAGHFTRYLKEERKAAIDIVEIDRVCAELASGYARDCYVGDIEQYFWKDTYANRLYDFIIFADVLEHLRDPWCVLKESMQFLKPDGRIIISVPNVAHVQILASLYNNDFSYSSTGILDKTHLRFFTEATVRNMVEEVGLQVCELVPIQAPILPEGCGTQWNRSSIPLKLKKLLSKKSYAYAMQLVACCKKQL